MRVQSLEAMDKYLKATELCDCEDPEIKRKALQVTKDVDSPKEGALKIFYFVRDQIPFRADFFDVKASDTLKKGYGSCFTKSNLQIALLRAAGIPARYHVAALSKDCLKGIISSTVYRGLPERILHHPWPECFLSRRWISCDAILDRMLYEACYNKGIISKRKIPTIDWDGETDLHVMAAWVLEDKETLHSPDEYFPNAQKELQLSPEILGKILAKILVYFSNRYTDRVRTE